MHIPDRSPSFLLLALLWWYATKYPAERQPLFDIFTHLCHTASLHGHCNSEQLTTTNMNKRNKRKRNNWTNNAVEVAKIWQCIQGEDSRLLYAWYHGGLHTVAIFNDLFWCLLVKPVGAGDTHGGLPPCAYFHHCIPLVKQEGSIQLCYISPR